MTSIPWPLTNSPGAESQEGGGKLINVFVERRGDEQGIVWRRTPGCLVFVVDPSAGTANASSNVLGISSVVNADGTANSSATAIGAGGVLGPVGGAGQAVAGSSAVGARSVLIAVDGTANAVAYADAVGST